MHLVHQLAVTRLNFGMYVCAIEVGVVFTLLFYCPSSLLDAVTSSLRNVTDKYVCWAHSPTPRVPSFAIPADKQAIQSKLPFWLAPDRHVVQHGPLHPVRLFRPGLQALYSKTRGGVDCAAQCRAELNCSGTTSCWEENLMLFFLTTLLVNSYTATRILENDHHLVILKTLGSLATFRNRVNKASSFGDYKSEVAEDLLEYAFSLDEPRILHKILLLHPLPVPLPLRLLYRDEIAWLSLTMHRPKLFV